MNKYKDCCPGCGKHCPMKSPCCGYGRKYFEKQKKENCKKAQPESGKKQKRQRHGLIQKLFDVRRMMKEKLRDGSITEAQLLASLSEEEQLHLARALLNLEKCMDACK